MNPALAASQQLNEAACHSFTGDIHFQKPLNPNHHRAILALACHE
jgi:hypothetical protein